MKTVFSNAQTIHVWASQTQPTGRNGSRTLWFDGPVLYSYSTPIALIMGDVALVSSVSYSMATSQHLPSARDLAPRVVFRVPFLPGCSGGRYEEPRPAPGEVEAVQRGIAPDDWRAQTAALNRAKERACHAGNLAFLVDHANEGIARAVRLARRTGRPPVPTWSDAFSRDWSQDAAWNEAEWRADIEPLRETARDYARRFDLAEPAFEADYGRADIMAACRAWHEREADPKLQRKRAADRARREARAEWLESVAAPILAEAGISAFSWDKHARAEAVRGIPATDAGASALRARLADRIARHAADLARWKAEEDARREREARERAEETARAEAHGFTLDEWRDMFGAVTTAEYWNAAEDVRKAIPARREAWRRGGEWETEPGEYAIPHALRGEWRQCEHGGDILRVRPNDPATLETARGAEVPTEHARRAWRGVLRIMCSGEPWRGSIRCGHFTISEITPEWMVAGCHRFHRAEMERVAALLGEPVTCEEISEEGESVA